MSYPVHCSACAPPPTHTQTHHSTPNTSRTANCSLTSGIWRSQYYVDSDILIEDVLRFESGGNFSQNLTAYPFQPCGPANWVHWTGYFVAENAPGDAIVLSCTRCTISSAGCLPCGPTKDDSGVYWFYPTCGVLHVLFKFAAAEHTYYLDAAL